MRELARLGGRVMMELRSRLGGRPDREPRRASRGSRKRFLPTVGLRNIFRYLGTIKIMAMCACPRIRLVECLHGG
jgi:hypothetical protein